MAVGGYGRRELCPGSDLDLILVHRGQRDVKEVAERVWYPVWDAGLRLDHSVRTVKEVVAVAAADLKAAVGLLDARWVAGDADLADEVYRRAVAQWRKRSRHWLPALREAVAARHGQFGEVAFLLEPELKEGRGGLRDVQTLRSAAVASPVVDADEAALAKAYETLLAVRVELHRLARRPLDRLLLQEQDAVAAALGHPDADALMVSVSSAARTIAWSSDDAWRRVTSALAGPRGRAAGRDRPLGPGLLLRDGEIVLEGTAVATDPSLPLRAAAAAADGAGPVSRSLLERAAAESPPPGEPWPPAARRALVALLGAGAAAIPVLEALDQHGLLVRVLPEWEAVRSRPQRNAYHRFTVDRHLCEAAAHAAALTRRVARPDLLLVGAWLHDIGKGFVTGARAGGGPGPDPASGGPGPDPWGGDHTAAGVDVVRGIATRMGFSPEDVEVLVGLVRHHLLLPDVATRRDLSDPATVDAVAAAVGDRDTLDLLAALTEADSLATGPAAWGAWKARLVAELVARTAQRLAGHRPPEGPALPAPRHRELMARGELAVVAGEDEVTVVAPDRRGLFCQVAGVLALHGLDVRSAAAASSDDGMAVEVFEVEPAFGEPPDWGRVEEDLAAVLAGSLPLEARLAERARVYARRRRVATAMAAEPRVLFDTEASASATVVEVRAPDGIGVLYRITRALADCGLDVRSAKVSTLGHEVVDAFYVRDADGTRITDARRLAEVESAVLAALSDRR